MEQQGSPWSGLWPFFQPGHNAGKGPPRRDQGEPGEAAEKAEHTWEWRAVCFGWGVRFSEGQIRGQGMADLAFLVSKGGRLNSEARGGQSRRVLGRCGAGNGRGTPGLLKGQGKVSLKSPLYPFRALGLLHPELPSTPHSPSLGCTCDTSFLPDLHLSHPSDLNLSIASSGKLPVICS